MTSENGASIVLNRLGQKAIVVDGSTQVELARRGYADKPCDRYNLTSAVVVEKIHADFIDAGATLIQTNTLNANRFALESSLLSARVQEINRKGVWIARSAAKGRAFVAGVIGPTGRLLHPLGALNTSDAIEAFSEQAHALVAAGCDVLLLKSFIHLQELKLAIQAALRATSTIPIIALKSFPEDGSILSGSFPTIVANELAAHEVQAVGSNGTVGPQRMIGIIESMRSCGLPLVAIPDIGIPTLIDGIAIYNAEADYVAEAAVRLVEHGASIIGAEGGASVEHIKAIAKAVANITVGSAPIKISSKKEPDELSANKEPLSMFQQALNSGFVSTVELDVPRGLDMSSVIAGAEYLKQHGVTAVNISDGARARLRMSPIAISKIVQDKTGMQCITHLACRDRNMVGLQSEVLGAHELGVRNILAVTGDPTHIGDFPGATSVYDVDSIGLIRALGNMNNGADLMNNPLGQSTTFCISCAANPAADDIEREIDRLAMKAEQGAHVAFSQPVFDEELLERFLERIQHIPIKFLLGIIPLRTIRHAEFLHYEVPGMNIPVWVREKLAVAGSTEHATELGIEIAVDFLKRVRNKVNGVYLMPPFKKYQIAVKILEHISEPEKTHGSN
ncbi:MAG: bifunctional homocysteine S-methyltransferase/methylenetetrahydrofolate reductase [Ignavibacteria bacterium]|nr:bifunctional homocysteine S-methyltransferase/methylenetetrahydrofolate reductase [Ignavibacteria bacterium]